MQLRFGLLITVRNSKKVVVQLRGGLGNQLFGLFAGLQVAELNKSSLVLDGRLIKFGSNKSRKLEIKGLDLTSIRTQIEIRRAFPLPKSRLGQKITRPFQKKIARYLTRKAPTRVVTDLEKIEDISIESEVLLEGYFSTFSHFKSWFETNSSFTLQPARKTRAFKNIESDLRRLTGLHIRLGDYLKHPDIYPIPSQKYYEKGLRIIDQKTGYVVFCENLEEAREYFPSILNNANLIVSGKLFNTTETLCLMASCKNLITANSTFSQWAGVFVSNQKGKVIYPSKFLLESETNTDAKDWIQLDIDSGEII